MIRDAEIRRIAGSAGVEPRIVELDYVLGWALRGIADHASFSRRLVFKGGTCLRKCYFAARDPKLRVVEDEYGRETLRLRIYWRGPHERGGSPPGLRLDITRNEVLAFDPVLRDMAHPFSDAEELGEVAMTCYSLEEVMAEKVRAVLGQRIHAVSRDLYDIFCLRERVDDDSVLGALPKKLAAREVAVESGDITHRLVDRKSEFRADWERNLSGLLPPGAEVEFEHAWESVVDYVTRMAGGLDLDQRDEGPQ